MQTTVTRVIDAPVAKVFETVAHIEAFSKVVPEIVKVEFLGEQRTGVGTRFRETRRMKGREMSVELEVTEYEPGKRVRIVADTAGTVWDTVFEVQPKNGKTLLTMAMDARAHTLMARIFNLLIKGMVRKGIERDMDAVKAHCER